MILTISGIGVNAFKLRVKVFAEESLASVREISANVCPIRCDLSADVDT